MKHEPLVIRTEERGLAVVVSPPGEYATATFHWQRNADGEPYYDAEANARLFMNASDLLLAAKEAADALFLWLEKPEEEAVWRNLADVIEQIEGRKGKDD